MDYKFNWDCQVSGLNETYKKYFGYKTDGTFIEIGACDGVSWSNTTGLYQIGWNGFMFEPDPNSYNECVQNLRPYPKVFVFRSAVGNRIGKITLHLGGRGASTTSEEFLKSAKIGGWDAQFKRTEEVYLTTLDNIYSDRFLLPEEVDIISIDTEGNEPDVLAGFSITKWKPKMMIVEAHEHYPSNDRPLTHPQINKYFEENHYTKIYSDAVNNIYVPD
jgi:FkbM family methyltransferase